MKQEERIRNFAWITALRLQVPLLELVGAGDIQGGDSPKEDWPGIRRQLFQHYLCQVLDVNLSGNSSHASPPITVAHLNTIDNTVNEASCFADNTLPSVVLTFSPFHLKVSPFLSLKCPC